MALIQDFDFEWTKSMSIIIKIMGVITSSQHSSFQAVECIYYQLSEIKVCSYYLRVLSIASSPLIMTLFSIPIWLLLKLIAKFRLHQSPISSQQSSSS